MEAANQNTESLKALSYKDTQVIEEVPAINVAQIPDAKAKVLLEDIRIPVQTAVESGKLPSPRIQV